MLLQQLGIPSDHVESRGLQIQPEASASGLTTITTYSGRKIQLIASAAAAWTQMEARARSEGVILLPVSGFRSIARQADIIRRRLSSGQSIETILCTNAAPGYSEHHTGRALDIGTPGDASLSPTFACTEAFRWLTAETPSFGFTLSYPVGNPFGIAFEPWHWCWSGPVSTRNISPSNRSP